MQLEYLRTYFDTLTPGTRARYLSALKRFYKFLPKTDLVDVTRDDVQRWFRHLLDDGLSGNTIRTHYRSVARLFDEIEAQGRVVENPLRSAKIKLPDAGFRARGGARIIDFNRVMEICNGPSRWTRPGIRDRAVLAMLFGGALRRSECAALLLEDVRVTQDGLLYLRLQQTKSGCVQEQALPQWAGERVVRLVETRKSDGVQNADALLGEKGLDSSTIYLIFRRWCEHAGLKGYSPHSARATAISALFAQKIPLRDIQLYARHRASTTTEGYDRRMDDVAAKTARLVKY